MSEETLRKLALRVRNWGRWGPHDEIGTLNYVTPAKIAEARRLVTGGTVFALGIPLQRQGPQSGTRARFNPIHTCSGTGAINPRMRRPWPSCPRFAAHSISAPFPTWA